MKITDVDVIPLKVPLPIPIRTAVGIMPERNTLLVRVNTDDGIVGIGESWVNYPSWVLAERLATVKALAALVIGQDPTTPERLFDYLHQKTRLIARQWGAIGPIYQTISALDIAFWDIAAKHQKLPLYRLLSSGPYRTWIPAYASGIGPDNVMDLIGQATDFGYQYFKCKVGFGRQDLDTMGEVVRSLRSSRHLLLDANQGWTFSQAMNLMPLVDALPVYWIEEPLMADNLDEMSKLNHSYTTPVAIGENLYGVQFTQAIEVGSAKIYQPDLTKVGGFTVARQVIQWVRDANLQWAPHVFGSAVSIAAALHLLAAYDDGLMLEYDVNPNPLRETLLKQPLIRKTDRVQVPDGPGLGIDIRDDVIAQFRP